jgi:divinyl chlorophyllide a 8-vinyl-reductase
VQKPLLEFQKAKLKFETELQNTEGLTWSIVRPTVFFKSLGGQVGPHSDRAYTGRFDS